MNGHWLRKRQILACLSHQHFVSGEVIAQQLSLTRAAINQHIDALKDYGIEIYSVKGRGYKLANPISLVNESDLLNGIDGRCFYFDETASTNAFMLGHATELKSGDICIAEYQSAGRGRRGRQWLSPYGHHIYASMFWRLNNDISHASGLSLVIGCSIVKTLADFGVEGLGLKWPNDIYLDHSKLAGILVEISQSSANQTELVIGFGINMSMSVEQGELIDQPWSDLSSLKEIPDKTELLIKLHKTLKADLQLFELKGLGAFLERWNEYDLFVNREVSLLMAPNSVSGICRGIDQQGALLLETEQGIKPYIGGEISLRAAI
ncbi:MULTISPECIES: bifunctional biotin--[acetyl-CoA-carboxylase] ligase/biotin operon repressor BirA [Shewanella]|uniref:Bifunctional ligase/repressor BirA n=1 Tax=Shewanella polaris TaxID=2588449 RepID=A0A4Y5YKD6_9GAMM|nr:MULTISPECIES: bifunctional biotin--[acetyl-CoA-carboxylase] ligase/biotin operon repressor BirA [Shewanella]QDE32959.1 bifunctional biotin--[acetyl-CoA-carboxylase] ligase/biotin operon repressor BirA [Shewanella polaris]